MNTDTAPSVIDVLFEAQAEVALRLRCAGLQERRAKLLRFRDGFSARLPAFVSALAQDLRKPAVEVELTELLPVLDEIRHALSQLKRWMRPHRVAPTLTTLGTSARIVYQPRGRCLIIGPWNYPVNTLLGPLVSAVAAGNTVILKPSEFVPHVNAVIAELIAEVFEPGEVALVKGAQPTATYLLSLPFDHIFFTGSPAVGKLVMGAAARHLGSVTLELGGKSPVIVEASADLQAAAEHILWGRLVNAGQTCVAPDHAYVHRSVYQAFVEKCRQLIGERYGADAEAVEQSRDLARMIHARHAERVGALVDDAVSCGAKLLAGGQYNPQSRFVAPTLLGEVPPQARISQEEIFGPVLPLMPYDSIDQVIARINDAPKPLALYLWTRDRSTVDFVTQATSSGSMGINLCVQQSAHSNLPFGGVNGSGTGNAHGFFGFKAFSHERAVLSAGPWTALRMLFPPYGHRAQRLSRVLLWLHQKV